MRLPALFHKSLLVGQQICFCLYAEGGWQMGRGYPPRLFASFFMWSYLATLCWGSLSLCLGGVSEVLNAIVDGEHVPLASEQSSSSLDNGELVSSPHNGIGTYGYVDVFYHSNEYAWLCWLVLLSCLALLCFCEFSPENSFWLLVDLSLSRICLELPSRYKFSRCSCFGLVGYKRYGLAVWGDNCFMEVFLRTTVSFILRTRRAIGVQGPCLFVFLDFHWILLGFFSVQGTFLWFSIFNWPFRWKAQMSWLTWPVLRLFWFLLLFSVCSWCLIRRFWDQSTLEWWSQNGEKNAHDIWPHFAEVL